MSDLLERKSVRKVKDFLNDFDSSIELIVLEETARTANDAAQSLNQSVGSIVKVYSLKTLKATTTCVLYQVINLYLLRKFLKF